MLHNAMGGGQIFRQNVTKVYFSMLLALRGSGWVSNFQKKSLCNTSMAPFNNTLNMNVCVWLQYPGNKAEKENKWEIPALVRLKIWLGLEKHESEWHRMQTEGELAVFAETVRHS